MEVSEDKMSIIESIDFEVELDDGRIAKCWRATHQEYKDCDFSAGLVEGIEPDVLYLRIEGKGEPLTIFLRPDEMLAVQYSIAGALWSWSMLGYDNEC